MPEPRIIRITSHYLENYEACPLYFHRVTNLKRGEPSKPRYLAVGNAIHWLLAEYYKGVREGKLEFGKLIEDIIERYNIEALSMKDLTAEDIDYCAGTFRQYVDHYYDKDKFTVLTVEEKLSKVLYESDELIIIYEGTIDLNVERDGLITPYDHKSESAKFQVSGLGNQFKGYCFLTDQPRVIRNAVGLQKTKKPEDKFYRTMFSYPQLVLNRWREDVIIKIKRMVEDYERNSWAANYHSCDSMFRRGCAFRTVCAEDESMWEKMLEDDFVHVELYS